MRAIDLTGKRFGSLLVLRLMDDPYISPGGKPTRRWLCRCERCGREVVRLQNTLKPNSNCGCARGEVWKNRPKNKKICPICGKEFEAPPTGRKTCSKECEKIHFSQIRTGSHTPWSAEAKARYRQSEAHIQQAKQQVVHATQAAHAIPEGKRGPQNRECKVWILRDPEGNLHKAVGLMPWARENYKLFEPDSDDVEATVRRIHSGFSAIICSLNGAPCRKHKGEVSTYKKWSLVSVYSKSVEDQVDAMMDYYKKREDEDKC